MKRRKMRRVRRNPGFDPASVINTESLKEEVFAGFKSGVTSRKHHSRGFMRRMMGEHKKLNDDFLKRAIINKGNFAKNHPRSFAFHLGWRMGWNGSEVPMKYLPSLSKNSHGLRRNAPRLNMYTPGEKYIGTVEIPKPDRYDADVWEIVKRGRVFVIGTATNSGLLTEYYFKMEQGESEQKALEEINADLEVLATDGAGYMSRVKRIPNRTKEASRQRSDKRRNLRGNPSGVPRQKAPRYSKTLPNKFYKIYWSHHARGDTAALIFKGDKIIKISMSELSRFWPTNEGLKMERLHVLGPFDSWDQAFASQK